MAAATRDVKTKIVIDGEKEFKSALTSINSELKKMSSELKLTETEYAGQANTTEALTAKMKALQNVLDAQKKKTETLSAALKNAESAQKAYGNRVEELKGKLANVQGEMEKMGDATGDNADEMAKLKEEQEKLNKELAEAEAHYAVAEKSANNWAASVNSSKVKEQELNRELQETNKYLDEAKGSADGCATSIDEMGNKAKDAGDNTSDAMEELGKAIVAAGITKALKEIVDAMAECVQASIEFESAIAGVFKTVDGTEEQLQEISDAIKDMATRMPASASEIAAVAEAAGQLGIATESITSFTETMVNLGVATNMTAEEAATNLARFANITGMSADNYDRLGSTIVALGNNFATTESEITAMSTNLASAGELAGLSEPEILALSAAMSSVGIAAEAGGTAMTQTLTAIETFVDEGGDNLNTIADIAGVSAAEFTAAWESSPITAIQMFISGIADMSASGESATAVLDDLGMSGVRQSNMIRSLALANEQFAGAIGLANQAWDANNALTEEASKRYATTESKIEMMKNSFTNLKTAIGDQLTPALGKLAEMGNKAFDWATEFVENNPDLIQALNLIVVMAGTVLTTFTAWSGITWIAGKVTKAVTAFNIALAANPAGAIALAIGVLISAIATLALTCDTTTNTYVDLIQEVEESRNTYQETAAAMAEENDNILALVSQVQALADVENKTALQKEQLVELTNQLNEAVPDLGLAYDEVTDSLNMTVDAMMDLIKAQMQQEELQEKARRAIEIEKQLAELKEQQAKAQDEVTRAQENYNNATSKGSRFNRQQEKQTNSLSSALTVAKNKYNALTEQIEALETEYDGLTDEAEAASEAINGMDSTGVAATVNEITTNMQNLTQSYKDAYASAIDSINGQISTFEKMPATVSTAVGDVISALDSQVEYLTNYSENLKKAVELGLSEGLVQALSDGSAESAAILQGIVDDGGKKIDELNTAFSEVSVAKSTLADTMAEAEVDFNAKCEQIVQDAKNMIAGLELPDVAAKAGAATGQAYLNGLTNALSGYIAGSYPSVPSDFVGPVKPTTNNVTVNVTSPKTLSPSEIAKEQTKALRWATQYAR